MIIVNFLVKNVYLYMLSLRLTVQNALKKNHI